MHLLQYYHSSSDKSVRVVSACAEVDYLVLVIGIAAPNAPIRMIKVRLEAIPIKSIYHDRNIFGLPLGSFLDDDGKFCFCSVAITRCKPDSFTPTRLTG